MNEETKFIRATHVKDPDTGEVLNIEKDEEYTRLLNAFFAAECKHEGSVAQYRVKIASGGFQVRDCCVNCGERLGTALSQKDKEWVASLPWQPEEHAATYKSRRYEEWQATLVTLARQQYADRGRFTDSYRDYMSSEAWNAKRSLVLKRCGEICEGCGVAKATEVHHRCYDHLGDEFLFELLGLCHSCHEQITAERRVRLGLIDDEPLREDLENLAY
jgi:hypothetical protein